MSTSVLDDNKIPSTIVNKFSKESKDDFTHSLSFSYVCLSAFLYASLSLFVSVCVSQLPSVCMFLFFSFMSVCLPLCTRLSLSMSLSLSTCLLLYVVSARLLVTHISLIYFIYQLSLT